MPRANVEYVGVGQTSTITFKKPNVKARDQMRDFFIGLGYITIMERVNGKLTYLWVRGKGQVSI